MSIRKRVPGDAEGRDAQDRFDAVITDQTMPDVTGLELAKEIRCIRPTLPIILCTGYGEMTGQATVREAGVCEYLRKPVAFHRLAGVLRQGLDAMSAEEI